VALLRAEFQPPKLSSQSDLRRQAASRSALSQISSYGYCHSLHGISLFSKVIETNYDLGHNVENKTLIFFKFGVDLVNCSKVTSQKSGPNF